MGMDVSPQQRIEDMVRVTELCIDLLKENEEHHGEVIFNSNFFFVIKTLKLFIFKSVTLKTFFSLLNIIFSNFAR